MPVLNKILQTLQGLLFLSDIGDDTSRMLIIMDCNDIGSADDVLERFSDFIMPMLNKIFQILQTFLGLLFLSDNGDDTSSKGADNNGL